MGVLNAQEFTNILHHNTNEVVYYSNAGKKEKDSKKKRDWRDYAGTAYEVSPSLCVNKNCYTSVNNFGQGSRSTGNVTSLNGYFVDIDISHKDENFSKAKTDTIVNHIVEDINKSELSGYTMLCYSGRGIALYYLYDEPIYRSNLEQFTKHRLKYNEVFAIFEKVLAFYIENHLAEIDWSVSDYTRVCRLPDTYNMEANRNASCEVYNKNNTYTVEQMWELFDASRFGINPKAIARPSTKKEKNNTKTNKKTTTSFDFTLMEDEGVYISKKEVVPAVYLNNARGIARAIEYLCKEREMKDGTLRNNTLFIYYNVQKVLHLDEVSEARTLVKELNSTFKKPLENWELQNIFNSVDNHIEQTNVHSDGYYMYKRETVANVLQMDELDIEETGFFKNKEKAVRTAKNKKRKKTDEKTIVSMLEDGHTWNEIAYATGRSNGFIARVSKKWKKEKQEENNKIHSNLENKQYNNIESTNVIFVDFEEKEKVMEQNGVCSECKVVNFANAYHFGKEYVEQDEELNQVLDLLMSGQNVYLCGKGGTGKSLVSKIFLEKMEELGKGVLVAAPSGLAAFSIGGATIHSLLKMDVERVYPRNVSPNAKSVKALRNVNTVLVDECGMLRLDHFAYLTNCIRLAERKYKKHIQFVIVGDFLQLPPVVTNKEREQLEEYYGKKLMFQAYEDEDLWRKQFFNVVSLKKNRRQMGEEFANMMDAARVGDVSCASYFNQFARKDAYYLEDGYVHLCAYRSDVNKINNHIIENHKDDASRKVFEAEVVCGNFDEKTNHLKTLVFYEGMPVMATKNTSKGYQNGSMGTVVKVCNKTVMVQFLGNENPTRVSKALLSEEGVTFKQIPLVPAYAVTIHKCQSQTFDKVVVHQGMFGEGQAYVALSRVKTPEGLIVCGTIQEKDIERPMLKNISTQCGLRAYELDAMFG